MANTGNAGYSATDSATEVTRIADVTRVTTDSTGAAAVANYRWQPMATCPRGVKVQLKGRGGVATYGQFSADKFWTGWAPLPKGGPD